MEAKDISVDKMSPLTKIVGVFTNPGAVFENLRMHPDWLIPVLISLLITLAFSFLTQDIMLEFQKEAIYENTLIPEEYKDTAIEQMENKTPMRRNLESFGGSIVQIILVYLIGAAAFMVFGNFILGGKASYKQVFSMFSWAGLIGCLELLVKLPMMLAKGSVHVYTSLAVLMDLADKKTVLFQIMNAFDLFTIWKIIVWGLGMSVIYKFSKAKGYTASITLFVIFLAISIGLSQIF